MQICDDVEPVKDKLVMEHLIETIPSYVRIWVKDYKPKWSKEAGKYANDYFQVRGLQLDLSNWRSTWI